MKYFFITILIALHLTTFTQANEVLPGVLRTPDSQFENLKDYPFKPNYMEIDGLRVHYLDEGPKDADDLSERKQKRWIDEMEEKLEPCEDKANDDKDFDREIEDCFEDNLPSDFESENKV